MGIATTLIQDSTFDSNNNFICSFNISNLFSCVQLKETIKKSCWYFRTNSSSHRSITETVFIVFMKFATMSMEFNFDNVMYKYIELLWVILWDLRWSTYFSYFMSRSYLLLLKTSSIINDMWMKPFVYLTVSSGLRSSTDYWL